MKNRRQRFVLVLFLFSMFVPLFVPGPVSAVSSLLRFPHSADKDPRQTLFEDGSFHLNDKILQQVKKDERLCLTLNDCIRISLVRNRDINLANEALIQADADVARALSAIYPFLGAEGSYTRLDEDLAFALGPVSMTFMEQDLYTAGIVLRQPVFMGGRLNAACKAAEYSRDAREKEKLGVEEEIIFQVTRAYYAAQVAEAFSRVALEGVSLLEVHEHDVAIFVREGVSPKLDLLRTQTELANARKELNGAENAFDLGLSSLKNLLVVDLEEPVVLIDHLRHIHRSLLDLSILATRALSKRYELYALRSQLAASEQGLKAAKGELLPAVALEGRYEYIKGDFRELDGGNHWTVGIGAQVPLWDWGNIRSKIRKAGSQVKGIKLQLQKAEESICLEVRRAYLDFGKAEKNFIAAESAMTTAKEAYRLAKAGYREGAGTNTDVLEGRTALSRADANHALALFECNVAFAALQRAVGTPVIEQIENEKEISAR